MEVHRGSSRYAFINGTHAFKVPRFDFITQLRLLKSLYDTKGLKGILNWFTRSEDSMWGLKRLFVRGFNQNLREGRLSRKLKDIVVPTLTSIFGLLNIQEKASPVDLEIDDVTKTLEKYVGDDIWQDSHTFCHPDNYGIHEGKVKLRDYGGQSAQSILVNHREDLRNAFQAMQLLIEERRKAPNNLNSIKQDPKQQAA